VPARDLGRAFAYAPKDFVGVMDAAIDLRSAADRLMDSQVVRLEWIKKKPEPVATVGPRLDSMAPSATVQPLDAEEIATLLRRGQDFLKTGDIASARLVLRRAANAGNAQAALALGASFDSVFLAELGVLGFAPDPAHARAWYQRAAELGSTEAPRRLERLGAEKGGSVRQR
jgi:TPR repeat protein